MEDFRDKFEKILDYSGEIGASYAGLLYQRRDSETIMVENQSLKSYVSDTKSGAGIRVVYKGAMGFASTSDLSWSGLKDALEASVKGAKSMKGDGSEAFTPSEVNKVNVELPMKVDPLDVAPEEKVEMTLATNKAAYNNESIRSTSTRWGFIKDHRLFMSTDGADVRQVTPLIGLSHSSIAYEGGQKETIGYSKGLCSGYEFMSSINWDEFAVDISNLALEAVKAKAAPAGTYDVVVDPDVVGLVLHEALGHATEGDGVATGGSVLYSRLNDKIGSDLVTIYDEGVTEGGYYLPYDDEGSKKGKLTLIENGVLKSYLSDRRSAKKLGVESSGNGRSMDFENYPIVRMTNYYMAPGDNTIDELVEGVDFGIMLQGKGGRGGQVDTGMGTFSFGVGPGRIIRNGEPQELVRGLVISGSVLDVLKSVDAVGKETRMRTSVFGGCGKGGQWVKVGMGGPSIRAKMTVGGR